MIPLTLSRYFAVRFFGVVTAVFVGVFLLVLLIDYVEMMRRTADVPNASAWMVTKTSFFRVPQVTERLLPFAGPEARAQWQRLKSHAQTRIRPSAVPDAMASQ